jgi:hypothetical protein
MSGLVERCRPGLAAILLVAGSVVPGCGLFDTRTPEPPSESNCFSVPQTRPGTVITNLQTAIAQKCVDTYAACFSGGSPGQQPLVFVPSAEAREQYAAVMNNWSTTDEQAYFRNLTARGVVNGFASLLLAPRDSVISPDSVVYSYDYTFTFQHTEPGFPVTARGNMQLSLAPDANNVWRIYRWVDLKTTDDVTWSIFKGRFSN